jgi:hypothetical protein
LASSLASIAVNDSRFNIRGTFPRGTVSMRDLGSASWSVFISLSTRIRWLSLIAGAMCSALGGGR